MLTNMAHEVSHRQEKRRAFKRQQRKRRADYEAEMRESLVTLKEGVEDYAKREKEIKK